MAVTDEIVIVAADITLYSNWRIRVKDMTPIGDRYVKGEARRYYKDGSRYYYRPITEAEMHRRA